MTEPFKATFTIVTTDGKSTTHIWDLSGLASLDEIRKAMQAISRMVIDAMNGKSGALFMLNPPALYNPSHVISIRLDTPGLSEAETVPEQVQRQLGFKLPSDSN
jgi:hypothetical protein